MIIPSSTTVMKVLVLCSLNLFEMSMATATAFEVTLAETGCLEAFAADNVKFLKRPHAFSRETLVSRWNELLKPFAKRRQLNEKSRKLKQLIIDELGRHLQPLMEDFPVAVTQWQEISSEFLSPKNKGRTHGRTQTIHASTNVFKTISESWNDGKQARGTPDEDKALADAQIEPNSAGKARSKPSGITRKIRIHAFKYKTHGSRSLVEVLCRGTDTWYKDGVVTKIDEENRTISVRYNIRPGTESTKTLHAPFNQIRPRS